MFSIRLPEKLENNLNKICKELDTPKSKIVISALEEYLQDLEDYIQAKKILNQNEPTIPHEELMREFKI